jgi:deoxyribodipyrimidine photo-lyase
MSRTALVWFRRDLRLADHPALHAALERAERVIPVFIHAPEEEAPWAPGAACRWWQHHSLAAFSKACAALGSPLVIRCGASLETLQALIAETGADLVVWNRLYEPAIRARDAEIKAALREAGVEAESFNSALFFEPWTVQTQSGQPYKVFSPFWRNAEPQLQKVRSPLPAPTSLRGPERPLSSEPLEALALLPRIAWDGGLHEAWTPGEAGALARLQAFADGPVEHYHDRRNLPAETQGTSGLSPHLHHGELSPQQALAALRARGPLSHQAEHFVRELGWREFAHHLLYHFPQTPEQALYHDKFAAFPWRKADDYAEDLRAWQRGATGIPVVDAGMRQLWHTGWMHNRVRMIVASFLTKNLLTPWQEGARWFWDTLVDASLASNTLGWQWAAGCGADAAPYFRVFNPVLQSEKFDPDAAYLDRWVPELKTVPLKHRHAPWTAAVPPKAYPAARVDLKASRDRALAAYGRIKG